MNRRIRRSAGLLAVAVVLQGCSAAGDFQRRYQDRWGPDPSIPLTDVSTVLERQTGVMREIARLSQVPVSPGHTPLWFEVARFGLNYVDEKCDVYMNDLFELNRQHDRNDSLLKKTDSVAQAIIGGVVSAASAKIPLLALGQAFGLLQSVNDAAAKSYLFEQQIPGIVADKVTTARLLYRGQLQENQRFVSRNQLGPDAIDDEASAYQVIRSYLNLCLPQTIEGEFLKTYIAAVPKIVKPTASINGELAPNSHFSASGRTGASGSTRFFSVTQSPPLQ